MTHVRTTAVLLFTTALVAGAAAQTTQKPNAAAAGSSQKHVVVTSGDVKWGPAPPSLPPGAQATILAGDPAKPGAFVIRAKFPDGYRVPPHWHPTDENVTVLSGSFRIGMGDKIDEASANALGQGDFVRMPKLMHHYALAKGETIIQVHGTGPFALTYVDPKDDPRKKTTETK